MIPSFKNYVLGRSVLNIQFFIVCSFASNSLHGVSNLVVRVESSLRQGNKNHWVHQWKFFHLARQIRSTQQCMRVTNRSHFKRDTGKHHGFLDDIEIFVWQRGRLRENLVVLCIIYAAFSQPDEKLNCSSFIIIRPQISDQRHQINTK